MLLIEVGIVIFAVVFVVIFAFMLNPPAKLVDKVTNKKKQ
jgi:hypothetical protein